VQMHSMGWLPLKGPKVGFTPTVTIEKNDFAKPRQSTNWDWYFDTTPEHEAGPDVVKDLLATGKLVGCINMSAGHPKLMSGDEVVLKLGTSVEEAVARLRSDPEVYQLVYQAVVAQPASMGDDEGEA